MEAATKKHVLKRIADVGPVLAAVREDEGLSTLAVANRAGLTNIAVSTVERGGGSPRTLSLVAEALGVEVEIAATVEGETADLQIKDLQQYIRDIREEKNISHGTLADRAGVQISSVRVFEESNRPSFMSITRYLEALGVEIEIALMMNGKPIPTRILRRADELSESIPARMTDNSLSSEISVYLIALRKNLGESAAEIARRSGVSRLMLTNTENSKASLVAFSDVAEALGYRLIITLKDRSGFVSEVPAPLVPEALAQMRENQNVSASQMARLIGSTYRSVTIFGQGKRNPTRMIERFAAALGIKLGFRLEEL